MPDWYRIENRTLPTPSAVIDVFGEIGSFGVSAEAFVSDLRAAASGAAGVDVLIDTPGGSVFQGITITNALRALRVPVRTYAMGQAASIGAVIFQGASQGNRFMAPNSRMMIHRASLGGASGNDIDFQRFAELLKDATDNIASIFADRSGKESAYWHDMLADGADHWFTPEAAIGEGLADAIALPDDEDERALAAATLLNLPRHEIAACIQNAGRTLSASNLEKLHGVFATLESIHTGACDMGDSCPLAAKEQGDPPANRHDARRREVDAILAALPR